MSKEMVEKSVVVNSVLTQTNMNISAMISEVNLVGGNIKEW